MRALLHELMNELQYLRDHTSESGREIFLHGRVNFDLWQRAVIAASSPEQPLIFTVTVTPNPALSGHCGTPCYADQTARLSHREPAEPQNERPNWVNIANYTEGDFYKIQMEIVLDAGGPLTPEQMSRASGNLGYALKKLTGEGLSDYEIYVNTEQGTILTFDYDSTKSRSEDPNFLWAFALAQSYVAHGSPSRTTTRIGPIGSQLVEGIGPCSVRFFVA